MSFSQCFRFNEIFFFETEKKQPCYQEETLPDIEEVKGSDLQQVIEALRKWTHQKQGKRYKFIVLLLNTEFGDLEAGLKKFIKNYPNYLKFDSGPDVLILHNYIDVDANGKNDDHKKKTYDYIDRFQVEKNLLPLLIVLPHKELESLHKNEVTYHPISLKEGYEKWSEKQGGQAAENMNQYFLEIFRCFFDAVGAVDQNEKNPIQKLKKKFSARLKKTGLKYTWFEKAEKMKIKEFVFELAKILK